MMPDLFDRLEHRFDGLMENFEAWIDRVTDFDFGPRQNSSVPGSRARRNAKLHLRLSTPVPVDFQLPDEIALALESCGVNPNAIHAALRNQLPAGTLLEIRHRTTKLRIEIEGHHDL
jgi:hypothetical protein